MWTQPHTLDIKLIIIIKIKMMMDMNIPRNSSEIDQFIDKVFYCGINSVISIIGILGNVLLLIIFIHPSLIPHKTLFHSYLKVSLGPWILELGLGLDYEAAGDCPGGPAVPALRHRV